MDINRNPYDHELEGVGNREQLLNDIEEGYYEGEVYGTNPDFWQHSNISAADFDRAQALWTKKKFGERIHSVLTQKP